MQSGRKLLIDKNGSGIDSLNHRLSMLAAARSAGCRARTSGTSAVSPDPAGRDGTLLPFLVKDLEKIIPDVFGRRRSTKPVTTAKAILGV